MTCVQKESSRGVLQERCSANMKHIHRRTTMQKRNLNNATLQLYLNYTYACSCSRNYTRPCSRKSAAHSQNNPLQGSTSGGLVLYVKRVLKDLNYKTLLFTVVKRNILTLKINKYINK